MAQSTATDLQRRDVGSSYAPPNSGFEVASLSDHATHDVATSSSSVDALLERNEVRTQLVLNNPLFLLLRDGAIDDERKQRALLECLAALWETFGTPLSAGEDPSHEKRSLGSLADLAVRDPVLRATSARYHHQVRTLDDAGKAVLDLVLETAGHFLGVLLCVIPEGRESPDWFETPAERMSERKEFCTRNSPEGYNHLHDVLEDAWDILDESTTRLAELLSLDG